MRGQLDPQGAAVGAAKPEQVIRNRIVGGETLDERDARLRIDEAVAIERAHVAFRRFARVSEDQFEMGVDGERAGRLGPDRADVHAFVNRLEQPREGRSTRIDHGRGSGFGNPKSRVISPEAAGWACALGTTRSISSRSPHEYPAPRRPKHASASRHARRRGRRLRSCRAAPTPSRRRSRRGR